MKPLDSRSQSQRKNRSALDKLGLNGVSSTLITPGTSGLGLLGVGILAPLSRTPDEYQIIRNVKDNLVVSVETVLKYNYFWVQYENTFIPRGDEKLFSFAVIITLEPNTVSEVAFQLGVKMKNARGLTVEEYQNSSFNHPVYLNQNKQPLQIRYAELATLLQITPGRLDNVPLGYPDFPFATSPITTQQGVVPQPPITNFSTSLGQTGGTAIGLGQSVGFLDTSVRNPQQVSPSSWNWSFGGTGASPTGSTAQNPMVTFGTTGSYSVTLTASNITGSTPLTKTNFVVVL